MSHHKQARGARTGRPRIRLHVLGAAGGVTGSLNLFEYFEGDKVTRFLLDVGLHQENETINHQNRLPAGITPADIDFVIMSHAHIDHSGYFPKLVKDGFKGLCYTHEATRDLLEILLPDSGYLQEEAADRANRRLRKQRSRAFQGKQSKGRSKSHRHPQKAVRQPKQQPMVQPLYTEQDARACLKQVKGLKYDTDYQLADGVFVKFTDACHILGAAVVTLTIGKGGAKRTFCFTGNIGRDRTPILRDLKPVLQADYVMSESTYGSKLHEKRDRLAVLAGIINRAYERASKPHPKFGYGVIVIPAFAIGRVQTVLYDLRKLMEQGRIPEIPVFLDSPMAIKATAVHRKHVALYNAEARKIVDSGADPFATPRYVECTERSQSELLDQPAREPVIIIGSSGMASGGRIIQHLEKRLPGKQNTVLFVGYQGTGTLGQNLVNQKAGYVRIHGRPVKVNATIEFMSDYSGHADYSEILRWMSKFQRKPLNTLLVHGEPESLQGLKGQIETTLGWRVTVPKHREVFELA
ncbi:MAG TPA: MBL fold metallo-hydrolase [Candidatus Obscuribacterales bacterium]